MYGLRSCLTRIGLAVTEQHLANAGCGWQCHACDLHGNGMPSMPPTGTMEADLLSGGRPDGDTTPDMADSLSRQDGLDHTYGASPARSFDRRVGDQHVMAIEVVSPSV